MKKTFLALVAAVLLTGCTYTQDRLADFADLFRLGAGVGYGLDVNVQATAYLAAGAGGDRAWKLVWVGRDLAFCGETRFDFNPGVPIIGMTRKNDENRIIGSVAQYAGGWHPWFDMNRRAGEVGVHVHAFLVNVEAGFEVFELFDFISSLFGLDLGRDDRVAIWRAPVGIRYSLHPDYAFGFRELHERDRRESVDERKTIDNLPDDTPAQ